MEVAEAPPEARPSSEHCQLDELLGAFDLVLLGCCFFAPTSARGMDP